MKTIKHRVTTKAGTRIRLTTDDTLTLAFPGMLESTPQTLAALISDRSIYHLTNLSESDCADRRVQGKSSKALQATVTGKKLLAL